MRHNIYLQQTNSMQTLKLTNQIIDAMLYSNEIAISRIDDVNGYDRKIKWKCQKLYCNHMWLATPRAIKKSKICPNCSPNARLTNENFDYFLLINNIPIKRLEKITTAQNKIYFKCLNDKCNHEWRTAPSNIKNKRGCRLCAIAKSTWNNEKFDKWIEEKRVPIKRIGNVIGTQHCTQFICLKNNCNYVWSPFVATILSGGGCPKCANCAPITNEIMDRWITDNNKSFIRIGDIEKNKKHIMWQCINIGCDNRWLSAPATIRGGSGCTKCAKNLNEKLIHKYLEENKIIFIPQYEIKNNYTKTKKFKVDFFIPKINLIIEYNGIQHYKPIKFCSGDTEEIIKQNFKKQRKRDKFIRKFCKNNKINLFEIDGRKFKKEKLINYIEKKIKEYNEFINT